MSSSSPSHEYATSTRIIPTTKGAVSVTVVDVKRERHDNDNDNDSDAGLTLLLLHGNSSSSRCFENQLQNPPAGVRRVIAFDYPGHGLSPKAGHLVDPERGVADINDVRDSRPGGCVQKAFIITQPETSYTMRGYAEAALAVLRHLQVHDVVVLGHSLGGHVAIELLARLMPEAQVQPQVRAKQSPHDIDATAAARIRCLGIMIVGTPPANGSEQVREAFAFPAKEWEEHTLYAELEVLPEPACEQFARVIMGEPHEAWHVDEVRNTDGRARRIMFADFRAGNGCDQQAVMRDVDPSRTLVAVVNGADDVFMNFEYIDNLQYGNLWEGKCYRLPGIGHAAFWEQPALFNEYLERFIRDCSHKI